MKNKVIKAQFNNMCMAGMILDMESVALYAGLKRTTALEVTPGGINIQPGQGNSLFLATYNIKGPGYKQSMPITDYLPTLANHSPRKSFDLPLMDEAYSLMEVGGIYAALTGVLL